MPALTQLLAPTPPQAGRAGWQLGEQQEAKGSRMLAGLRGLIHHMRPLLFSGAACDMDYDGMDYDGHGQCRVDHGNSTLHTWLPRQQRIWSK